MQRVHRPYKTQPPQVPVVEYILTKIPLFPNDIGVDALRGLLTVHPLWKHSTASLHRGLLNRLETLLRRRQIIRTGKGTYARPRNRQDLDFKWRPADRSHYKIPLALELKMANARLRDALARGQGTPPPLIDPFS